MTTTKPRTRSKAQTKRASIGHAARAPKAGRSPKARNAEPAAPAAKLIDERIDSLPDWRGATLARMRALILEAAPSIVEEWKWSNPVWSRDGIICTGETYKNVVKLTFARGAALPDPAKLFNSSLDGNTRRAIDIRESERVDAAAFKALIRAAAAHNRRLAAER